MIWPPKLRAPADILVKSQIKTEIVLAGAACGNTGANFESVSGNIDNTAGRVEARCKSTTKNFLNLNTLVYNCFMAMGRRNRRQRQKGLWVAATVLACALTDLLRGRDTAEILSWVQGCPAALPFWMACHWLDISPRETRQRLRAMAANPSAYQEPLKLVSHRRSAPGPAS